MNIVNDFKNHLFTDKSKPSKITVKNYLSDVRKFLSWYENHTHSPFIASQLTTADIKTYQNYLMAATQGSPVATRSAKRYISSLRKFCRFLRDSGAIEVNPFDALSAAPKIPEDPWQLKHFKNGLISNGASRLTIKNYMLDIQQFLTWLEKVTVFTEQSSGERFTHISAMTINQYKERLMREQQFSATSINRKLSSLRKYLTWLADQGLIEKATTVVVKKQEPAVVETSEEIVEPIVEDTPIPLTALHELAPVEENETEKPYSRFAPVRLFQKTKDVISKGSDVLIFSPVAKSIESIQYNLWLNSDKNVFTPVKTLLKIPEKKLQTKKESKLKAHAAQTINIINQRALSIVEGFRQIPVDPKPYVIRNISKSFYAPLSISLANLSWQQRLIHYIRFVRPNWYRKYHSWPITNHIHIAILMFAMAVAGYACYQAVTDSGSQNKLAIASQAVSPPRKIAFQGRLLDKTNTPITAETPLRFAIYNSPTASGAAMLWQEVQEVTPNQDGYFSTQLGKRATLTQELLNNNTNVYVGISVASNSELSPRRQLATTGYASNSQSLQGLKPITGTDETQNVILALDSSGNLTIGGNSSPTFQATGGQFTVSGQTLLLTTNPGSNGNIELSPNGSGIIDAQAPITNTTNNSKLSGIAGAVEIGDVLAVVAKTSSQSALAIKQNSTGDIISGFSNEVAKFKVDNAGNGMFAGNITIGGNTITTNANTFGIANTNVINLSIGDHASALTLGGSTGFTTIRNDLSVQGKADIKGPASVDGMITANGGLTVSSGQKFTLAGFTPAAIPFIGANNEITQDPSSFQFDSRTKTVNVIGSVCIKATSGACAGATAGTIYASNATVQAADLAENYISSQKLEPGDVVIPESLANSAAILRSTAAYQPQVIGIVSTKPGFTLNSDAKTDTQHPNVYPLALQGRVPVKVSTMNGEIHAGDPLTSSSIPGVAMKATKPGQNIAKALEEYTNTDPNAVGKIMSFVNISYQIPQSTMTDSGDLKLAVAAGVPTVSEEGKTLADTTTGGAFIDSIETVKAKVIQATTMTTDSLAVATDNITIHGQSLQDYITTIVKGVTGQNAASTNPIASLMDSINLASGSATLNDVQPHATSAATLAASPSAYASTSAEPLPTTQPFASNAATLPAITPRMQPLASPSATPTITVTDPGLTPQSSASEAADLKKQIDNLVGGDTTNFMDTLKTPSDLGLEKLDTKDATVSNTLNVMGRTTLTDVGITGKVTIGLLNIDGLTDSGNVSIDTTTGPLKFQSHGLNGVDFMNGKVAIDGSGNLNVNGNAFFAKNVTVKGTLAANIIAPIPGSDLTVKNDHGNGVLKVSQDGDVAASGSGQFAGINIVRGAQADTSVTQTNANGSAGKGVIRAHQKERTIFTPYVTRQSLIYVTATSDTQKTTPYVARQTAQEDGKGSFTVQISTNVSKDISFNWWIVN